MHSYQHQKIAGSCIPDSTTKSLISKGNRYLTVLAVMVACAAPFTVVTHALDCHILENWQAKDLNSSMPIRTWYSIPIYVHIASILIGLA